MRRRREEHKDLVIQSKLAKHVRHMGEFKVTKPYKTDRGYVVRIDGYATANSCGRIEVRDAT